jgi:exodeoxyribonuclease V alpha subunit
MAGQRHAIVKLERDIPPSPPSPRTPEAPNQGTETLIGALDRITYHAPDNGWTIARLIVAGTGAPVAVVGIMLGPEVGESVRLFGEWQTHPRYGRQFRFERYQLVRPATTPAIRAYLGGGLVEGVGPMLAGALADHFGEETLDVLDSAPERLTEVTGIGRVRAGAIREAWARHQSVHRVMVFLHEHGVGGALAARIHALFGDQAAEIMERQPYRLAREVRGIGFLTADRIARRVGVASDDPARVDAGILHVLHTATSEGHVYLPEEALVARAMALLDVGEQGVQMGLSRLAETGEVRSETYATGNAVYGRPLYEAEVEVAQRLLALATAPITACPSGAQVEAWLERRVAMGEVALSPEQAAAVVGALRAGLCLITGGPGTGKTTVTRAIVDACRSLGRSVSLASPTGRAAKRLQQLAGHEASTVHRLLAYDPYRHGFRYGAEEPLPAAVVVLDEASMLDLLLARDLLRALPPGRQVVFIGDADQLPSVGPGSFMRDLIRSGAAAVHRLTRIFRQAAESDIVQSAHLLNRGESPRFPTRQEWVQGRGDCVFLEEDEPEAAADRAVRTAVDSLPRLGFAPRDIQVITPLHRGPIGVSTLNQRLQEALNPASPHKAEVKRGEVALRVADRVLQVTNNYDKSVFNGDIGFVSAVNPGERRVLVSFEDGEVSYDFSELDELELAYALTVHKSQGSEYPAVVLIVHSSHYVMLQRNLLYTALTRAQRMACVVGNQRGLWRAIRNTSGHERFSHLAQRLESGASRTDCPGQLPGTSPLDGESTP